MRSSGGALRRQYPTYGSPYVPNASGTPTPSRPDRPECSSATRASGWASGATGVTRRFPGARGCGTLARFALPAKRRHPRMPEARGGGEGGIMAPEKTTDRQAGRNRDPTVGVIASGKRKMSETRKRKEQRNAKLDYTCQEDRCLTRPTRDLDSSSARVAGGTEKTANKRNKQQ